MCSQELIGKKECLCNEKKIIFTMTNVNELLDEKYGKEGTISRAFFEIETMLMMKNESPSEEVDDEEILARIYMAVSKVRSLKLQEMIN